MPFDPDLLRGPRTTFSHSGNAGDILYTLPVIRALGGGELRVFSRRPETCMTPESVASLAALLDLQPYVTRCVYSEELGQVDLDAWVRRIGEGLNIADTALRAFGCRTGERNRPWLQVDRARRAARVVFHRSGRYRNPDFPWRRVLDTYGAEAVIVGSPEEHEAFCREVGPVAYFPTQDYLQLARMIAGCELFVGNQSSPYAIAEAMKKPTVQEICPFAPNCIFDRPDATHGFDGTVLLPLLS